MKKSIGALSFVAMVAFAIPAVAEDFPATPLSPAAPTNLPGENLVPGLPEALNAVNVATQPLLQPLLVPGASVAAAGAEAAPPAKHHLHHRAHHRLVSHLWHHHAHHTV